MAKLSVILGSTREQRMGERVATWVMHYVSTAELLDLKVIDLPLYNEPKTPDELAGKYSSPVAQKWRDKIMATDKIIFVTPEYNHSYPAALKNAIDYMFNDWKGKSYIIVSYSTGAYGGVRGAMQLRGLLDYIGLDCKGEINIPLVDQVLTADGVMSDKKLTSRLEKLVNTL
ncbi:MAG TPA: NADPH-dependent FMN reductase [Candidatus Kerfeldbacteria bacterium]|nr:NADPH-dependent FMN reductase [Candidatus Kerfeldbacteria bacterium]